MIFAENEITGTVEILASKDFQAIPIKVAVPGSIVDGKFVPADDPVVKAGTPLTADGASTTGAGAIGILLYDVDTATNPNGAAVVIGIIDSVKAQAHSGVTYAAAALKSALPAVILRDNIGVNADDTAG